MAEQVFKFPSVAAREIDLSQPSLPGPPTGDPAGVIGTSQQGPAFVPITVGDITTFESVFGDVSKEHFGTLAVKEWFRNQSACTYTRVLGVGDGKKRLGAADSDSETPAGGVKNAGFVVGSQLCSAGGKVEKNKESPEPNGLLGRTYFLGCFMSESNPTTSGRLEGQGIFSSAGIQDSTNQAASILLDMDAIPAANGEEYFTTIIVPSHCIPGAAADHYHSEMSANWPKQYLEFRMFWDDNVAIGDATVRANGEEPDDADSTSACILFQQNSAWTSAAKATALAYALNGSVSAGNNANVN